MKRWTASRVVSGCRTVLRVAFALCCLAASGALAGDWFDGTNVLRIAIDIPPEGLQILADSRSGRRTTGKPEAQATVTEGERRYTNVSVQLKGYTTFRDIHSLPSLTLDFNKQTAKQSFHGLTKLSLNNSLQDPTRLHEKLSREIFAAAGVPVPRADFALVTLNGRDLGLYVLAEGFDKEFLKRHFARADGTLFEGGILRDIDAPLQIKSGEFATNDPVVRQLIRAAREPEPRRRLREIEAVLDLDRFLSMVAVETILCHSDSYSMNRNNYRMYHDPTSRKLVFLPHGMDRVLGTHRSRLDLSVVPPALGLVAHAVLSTEEGRARYLERTAAIFTNHFDPESLCRRVREIDAKIFPFKAREPNSGAFDSRTSNGPADDAANLCQRISTRAAHVRVQFAHPNEFLVPAPAPDFGAIGAATIDQWWPKRRPGGPEISCERTTRDGRVVWRVRGVAGTNVALRSRLTLAPGSYTIAGGIRAEDADGRSIPVAVRVINHTASRYAIEERRVEARQLNQTIRVAEPRLSDEIELVCELRNPTGEVWFDASTLRLSRGGGAPGIIPLSR